MSFAYLGALLASMGGVALLDRRWRLALWHDPRRTLAAVAASTLVLLVWDLVAISIDLFRLGESAGMTGIELAPHLPIEEPVFLVFLSYLAIVAWRGAMRVLAARRPRTGPAS
ncbi:lycopene cyclase domain-containing protein [Agrococcus sp. SGAir0287]|nr:lycopene cyclase domain-containing protein [Agrococcus sp. SGAir0287]